MVRAKFHAENGNVIVIKQEPGAKLYRVRTETPELRVYPGIASFNDLKHLPSYISALLFANRKKGGSHVIHH